MRVISYGGGVQSTALLVLAAHGELGTVDAALFANVGDDSEHPDTLRYFREHAKGYGERHGIPVIELHRRRRTGEVETLMQRLERVKRAVPIPIRVANGAPGNRTCTMDFKIAVIDRWLREHGVKKEQPAECLIGFSWDEIERLGNKRASKRSAPVYPLIDRRLTREDCKRLIERAGLAVPPKSSCFFCPFHRPSAWARMRRDEPELFQKSVELERMINDKRLAMGRDAVNAEATARQQREPSSPKPSPPISSLDAGGHPRRGPVTGSDHDGRSVANVLILLAVTRDWMDNLG